MRICAFDNTDRLSPFWDIGSKIGGFDLIIPCKEWDDLFGRLDDLDGFDALQWWGHGNIGHPYLGPIAMPEDRAIEVFDRRAGRDAYFWMRNCSVFQGVRGQRFAERLAEHGDLKVVGHTRIVSQMAPTIFGVIGGFAWQSGGYGLRPGESAHWSASESGWSAPWKRNTCSILQRNPPAKWFQAA